MAIIVDPPVTPYSSPEEIEEWLGELEDIRSENADDPEALETIQETGDIVHRWLDQQREQVGPETNPW